jgi:hypothetical protein
MEEDTILVLFDLCGDFAEGQDDGRGLGLRQSGVLQRVRAQGMVQGRGRTRAYQTHGIGQEGRRGGAITLQITLHRLAIVFAIPTGALEVFVDHLGRGSVKRGDDKAGGSARAHDFCLEHDPPWLCPGLGSLDALVVEAAPDRRRLAMGLGQRAPLVMQTTRLLEGGRSLAEQDSIPSQAKDKIGPAPMREYIDDLWGGNMTIPADQDVGRGPVAAQRGQEPH